VIVCDSEGKLSTPPATPGKEFKTDLRCGPKPGRIDVEIRGENNGAPAIAASFSVFCGGAAPGSVAVPASPPAVADPASEEKRLLAQVNGERATLGLPALIPLEELGRLARAISESESKELARGAHYAIVPADELKKAGISTPLALFNPPMAARSADEAMTQLASSPVLRCNALSPDTTHAGFGIAPGTGQDGTPLVLVTETFIKVLPPVDPVALRAQVREVVLAKRAAIPTSKSASDPALEQVAQRYAEALAESGGKLDNAKSNTIISPLYKGYKNLEINPAAQNDALVFANDPSLLGKGNTLGVGLALGDHPQLGKNAVFLVVLIATKR
jgi:uncharacterized protein YkwD